MGGPRCIPRTGSRKKQTVEEALPQPAPSADSATSSEHAEDLAECSERGYSQFPDKFIDSGDEGDAFIEALSDGYLGGGAISLVGSRGDLSTRLKASDST